ncbi:2-amino-4-hydroxy-6-hydroxymethyldihydropteridine diphosphokinase [Chitinilyticum piscinae]|uniref:2-amino-4-hydroxy-6-hydroxymethyldihydropteridine pyrophosphokinase n=1 Tax=Chitinilyticum piscinae TaxID=2866724 RepID=A0A8J7K2T4_9NEIS|nr:2-amino-4-hydroxy-6-hydroxymethyldihydropteridine diphosphokinase [Chitinilyticum piscinae]MBE9610462.1 2-amino-4-hydroxy-6-hydroxymethyldihydropteridine diphosphokinase [Chitinilyticum piscinae]
MTSPFTAYVALGANLGDPQSQLRSALAAMSAHPAILSITASSFYASAPVGYANQPDFVNAVARVTTLLMPEDLLQALLDIEQQLGRVRSFRNAPRTLDLDVLLHGGQVQHSVTLTLPHPRMHERAFVLLPLLELDPEIIIPGRGAAREYLAAVADQNLTRLD